MQITFDDFIRVCPAAQMPDEAVFESISGHIDEALAYVRSLITPAIFDSLPSRARRDVIPELADMVAGYVCASAFEKAIPQLDLVLTPTGFGVVSNQNVAPASAERVKSLRSSLRRSADYWLDLIIDHIRPIIDWSASPLGSQLIDGLFWRGDHMVVFGHYEPTREELHRMMPSIRAAGLEISRVISPELYGHLVEGERTASLDSCESELVDLCRRAMAQWIDSRDSYPSARISLLRYIEKNADRLPLYLNSSTYRAHHATRYENKKNDPCYFF